MMGCELIWEPDEARKVKAMMEEATGQPCPCLRGLKCLLVSEETIQKMGAA